MLLSLVLITVYFREPASGGLHSVQSTGATVLRPFEVGANRIAAPFRDTYNWFAGLIDAKSENERLRAQIDQLRAAAIQNVNAAQQVDDLRRQLKYVGLPRFPQDYNYVDTDVISRSAERVPAAGRNRRRLEQRDPRQRPGRDRRRPRRQDQLTWRATPPQVTLLTDSETHVSAIDVKSQATGLVNHGEGPSTLTLDRVLKSQVLHEGDLVVTQGWKFGRLSSLYPYGIPIGTVSGATNSEVDLYWNAQVPAVRPLRLAALGDRADPEAAEPAVSPNLLEPFKVAVLMFVAAILQVTIFSQIDILGGYPDVVLLTLVAVALLRGSIYGAAAGFFAGLIVDTANLATLGVTSLLLTIAGYWIGRYGETTGRDRAHAPYVSVAVATILVQFGALILHYLLGDTVSAKAVLIETLPPKVALNLLLTLPVYALTRRLLAVARPVETATEVRLLG